MMTITICTHVTELYNICTRAEFFFYKSNNIKQILITPNSTTAIQVPYTAICKLLFISMKTTVYSLSQKSTMPVFHMPHMWQDIREALQPHIPFLQDRGRRAKEDPQGGVEGSYLVPRRRQRQGDRVGGRSSCHCRNSRRRQTDFKTTL